MNREQEKVSFQKTTIKEKIAAICLEMKRSGAERMAEKREWRGERPPPISPQVKQEKGGGVPDHTDNKRWRRITSVKWLLMLKARGASCFLAIPVCDVLALRPSECIAVPKTSPEPFRQSKQDPPGKSD